MPFANSYSNHVTHHLVHHHRVHFGTDREMDRARPSGIAGNDSTWNCWIDHRWLDCPNLLQTVRRRSVPSLRTDPVDYLGDYSLIYSAAIRLRCASANSR